MRILLGTTGMPQAAPVIASGARLARQIASAVDILAVPGRGAANECRRQIESAVAGLDAAGVPVQVLVRRGSLANEVLAQAWSVHYDLVVVGRPERQGIMARLTRPEALTVAGQAPSSVLVVSGRESAFQRFLVCTSGGPLSSRPTQFAANLARRLGAGITLLHVMSQLPLAKEAVVEDLAATATELIQRGSPEGTHLRQMLAGLEATGVTAQAVVRHGLVVDEILAEARRGDYDLIVVGAHTTPGLPAFLVEDLASDVVRAADRPVLIVRGNEEPAP